MRVLDRYLLREFLKLFALTIISFVALYLIVDLFEQIDDIFENHLPLTVSIRFFIYKIPFIFYQVSPIAVLMATLLTMGILSRHRELTAVKAGGVSIMRCALPIFFCGLVISFLNLFVNEAVVPLANRENFAIKREWFDRKPVGIFNQGTVWFRDSDVIYSIQYLDMNAGDIRNFTMYRLGSSFVPVSQLHADKLVWRDNQWRVTTGVMRRFTGEGGITTEVVRDTPIRLLGGPEEIGRYDFDPDEMSYGALRRFIKRLKREGYGARRYRVDLNSKIAFPFVNLVMVLIGIPFAVSGGRRGGLALSVTVTVLIGFSYWIINAINISLGHSGVVPPFVAAWFTNIIFATVGLLMLSHVRQ
ncbi:MAG: LPS export ABC transporter permease LptG [Thermodesulfobacteriota bacterium]